MCESQRNRSKPRKNNKMALIQPHSMPNSPRVRTRDPSCINSVFGCHRLLFFSFLFLKLKDVHRIWPRLKCLNKLYAMYISRQRLENARQNRLSVFKRGDV
jgi:hypothetical protein